jgi:protein-S-isoprenylcysteine O-methyltransferase Ste14
MSLLTAALPDLTASISLAVSVFVVSYITSICFTPSNIDPETRDTDQKSYTSKVFIFYYGNAALQIMGIYHAILCFTYPEPPSRLCPRSSNISPILFTWNLHTGLCVGLILIAGQILLQCFTRLGPNYSLELSPPKTLITSGPYSWVQHPSYAATIIIFLTNGALFQRRDGVAACWLPSSIVDGEKFRMAMWIGYLGMIAAEGYALMQRVKNEEAVLKRTFGTEWEEYHKKTKRFIPGVI